MADQDRRTVDRKRRRRLGLCAESGCPEASKAYRCAEHARQYARRLQRFRIKRLQEEALARR